MLTDGFLLFHSRFLLKYASRDEIEILSRGNGGIVEIRNAIAQHDETAPLFGFLRYRRRNVILKYLPDECSRLVQGLSQLCPAACIIQEMCPYQVDSPPALGRDAVGAFAR